MPRGQPVRYASALVGVLGSLALVAGCGSQPASLVAAPTTPATTGAGVTAPPSSVTVPPDPVFSPLGGPATTAAPLAIAALPRATAATPVPTSTPSRSTSAPSRTTSSPVPSPAPSAGVSVVPALIPYPASRLQEMANYSLRHYGSASWQLSPTMIVLHFTDGSTAAGARATFAADTSNMGELPGTCAHYLVDKDGTVLELVPPNIRCRHTIGLNDSAIGIEMVQEGGSGASWADRQILNRPAQIGSALALVRSLQAQFGIATSNVVGHATANAAPQFHDLLGWRNDHDDWQTADVAEFRARL